jgi:hypothetical protein
MIVTIVCHRRVSEYGNAANGDAVAKGKGSNLIVSKSYYSQGYGRKGQDNGNPKYVLVSTV